MPDKYQGPYDRNVFDLWLPDSKKPTPLIVYIHGGGFVGGRKDGAWRSPRIACQGGSAGAGTSIWLAFHNDLANPLSNERAPDEKTLYLRERMVDLLDANSSFESFLKLAAGL